MTKPVPQDYVKSFLADGFAIVERFFDGEELAAIRSDVDRLLPGWPEAKRISGRFRYHQFPFGTGRPAKGDPIFVDALNYASLDDNLVDFICRCMGTDDIALNNSGLVGKYPGGFYDQPHHQDYHKYSLVVPDNRSGYRQMTAFLYWDDVTEGLGPTCILPHEVATGLDGLIVPKNVKQAVDFLGTEVDPDDCRPELYEHEVKVVVPAGSLLVYHTGVFHRGSELTADAGRRASQHLIWRATDNGWNIGGAGRNMSYVDRSGDPVMIRFMERMTPRQRSLIGFPPVGSDYWTEETLRGVGRRYPGIDMTPYREGRAGS